MSEDFVFFDFDKTLVKRDTLRPFALYISRERKNPILFLTFLSYFLWFKLNKISNKRLKEIFLKLFFDGYPLVKLKELISGFERDFIKIYLNRNVMDHFNRHIENGNKVFIVSANLNIFLENLAMLRSAGVIATEVEHDRLKNTYKLNGNVCLGLEKSSRLRQLFGDQIFHEAIFYGDKEDRELLKKFKRSIIV